MGRGGAKDPGNTARAPDEGRRRGVHYTEGAGSSQVHLAGPGESKPDVTSTPSPPWG